MPPRGMLSFESDALLATVTLPVTVPAADGPKVTDNVVVCPAARIVPAGTPLALNPAPAMLTLEISTVEVPALVRTVCRVLLLPTFTLLKFRVPTLAVSVPGVEDATVSDTG